MQSRKIQVCIGLDANYHRSIGSHWTLLDDLVPFTRESLELESLYSTLIHQPAGTDQRYARQRARRQDLWRQDLGSYAFTRVALGVLPGLEATARAVATCARAGKWGESHQETHGVSGSYLGKWAASTWQVPSIRFTFVLYVYIYRMSCPGPEVGSVPSEPVRKRPNSGGVEPSIHCKWVFYIPKPSRSGGIQPFFIADHPF